MRNYTTQMDAARKGILTPEMKLYLTSPSFVLSQRISLSLIILYTVAFMRDGGKACSVSPVSASYLTSPCPVVPMTISP